MVLCIFYLLLETTSSLSSYCGRFFFLSCFLNFFALLKAILRDQFEVQVLEYMNIPGKLGNLRWADLNGYLITAGSGCVSGSFRRFALFRYTIRVAPYASKELTLVLAGAWFLRWTQRLLDNTTLLVVSWMPFYLGRPASDLNIAWLQCALCSFTLWRHHRNSSYS